MKKRILSVFCSLAIAHFTFAQPEYSDFALQNCTGSVSNEQFQTGFQSYKMIPANNGASPQIKITISGIPNWQTITKATVQVFRTGNWNNGGFFQNSQIEKWTKALDYQFTVKDGWDLWEIPLSFDPANGWGQFLIQSNNKADAGVTYFDEITFYNAAGTVLHKIDAEDVDIAPPTTEYDDFTIANGSVGTALTKVYSDERSLKIVQDVEHLVGDPEISQKRRASIKVYSFPNIGTVTKISCMLFRTDGWDSGRLFANSSGTGWLSNNFSIPANTWTKVEIDVTGISNDGWAEFGIEGWNNTQTLYADEIIFSNAAGDIVYKIDAADGTEIPSESESGSGGGITTVYKPNAWINEIDYVQNAGADATTYDDMVEVVIYKPEKHNLADFSVVLYNGFSGTPALTETLDNFIPGDEVLDFQIFHSTYPDGNLSDNKAGIALVYKDEVVSFVSYGGSFTATDGPAKGLTAKDIAVAESGADNMSVQLIGDGFQYQDFTWVDPLVSAGSGNGGQNLADPPPVPLDGNYIYFLFVAIAAVVVIRKFV